jgi:hypothetical protein
MGQNKKLIEKELFNLKTTLIRENQSLKRKPIEKKFNTWAKIYNFSSRTKRKIKSKLGLNHEDINFLENKWL